VALDRQDARDQFHARGIKEVIDLRTDDYIINYALGAAGHNLPEGTNEVLGLVLDARNWILRNQSWLDAWPKNARLRELGEKIYQDGGMPAMWRAAAFVGERTKGKPPCRTLVNDMWDGVGEWIS
jgi:hypothetical protein